MLRTLVLCLINNITYFGDFCQNGIACCGPDEGPALGVISVDERSDLGDEIFCADEGGAPARRVVVMARIVRHRGRKFTAAPLVRHVGYLKRDGVTRMVKRRAFSTPRRIRRTPKPSRSAAPTTGIISGSSSRPRMQRIWRTRGPLPAS